MSWWAIIGMAVITFLNRFAFLSPGVNYAQSEKLTRFLSFASLAVLTAIWVPIVIDFNPTQGGLSTAGWDYLLASLLAMILSLARLNSLLVVVLSSVCFFTIRVYL